MSDNELHKMLGPQGAGGGDDHDGGGRSFRCLRGGPRDRALMLQLRKRSGNVRAIAYSALEYCDLDLTDGITLYVAGMSIRIRGRNLDAGDTADAKLFSALCRHRLVLIQETSRPENLTGDAHDSQLVVDSIEW